MATPTKKGIKKVPKPVWIIGGIGVVAAGYYYYRKKKEESVTQTGAATTAQTGEGVTSQSFVPVVSENLPGAGASRPYYYPEGENKILEELVNYLKEEVAGQRKANEEDHAAQVTSEKERKEGEANTLNYIRESTAENNRIFIESIKSLTGGGSPGTTDSGSNPTGGSPAPTVVANTQPASTHVSNITKALFGGRSIVHPNEPNSYIVAANGKQCPNNEWNRDHPKQMRGCK